MVARRNPLNFRPPLPASSDALAQRVVGARDALNALGIVEYATQPERVAELGAELEAAREALAEINVEQQHPT